MGNRHTQRTAAVTQPAALLKAHRMCQVNTAKGHREERPGNSERSRCPSHPHSDMTRSTAWVCSGGLNVNRGCEMLPMGTQPTQCRHVVGRVHIPRAPRGQAQEGQGLPAGTANKAASGQGSQMVQEPHSSGAVPILGASNIGAKAKTPSHVQYCELFKWASLALSGCPT